MYLLQKQPLPDVDKLAIDEFIEFMDEIRRMNELINISKMLPIMKRFNGELAKQSTLVGKLAVLQGLTEAFSSK
jgi:signal recognition particle GTPase